ncbi:MAG TPA: S8 family serine peptidase [Myxococcales bacterium]|jgi:subtilisin family serine protease
MNARFIARTGLAGLLLATACGQYDVDAPSDPSQLGQQASALDGEGRYIVKFKDHGRGKGSLAAHGAKLERDLPAHRAVAARLSAQALETLQSDPNVEYVEEDAKREPLALDSQILPWGIVQVQARAAELLPALPIGASMKVCIIDSGLQLDHPDFAGMTITGDSEVTATNPWSVDKCGHGTHVAGTIAALDDASGVVGVAPGVALHVVKVFGDDCGWAYASELVGALQKCREAGAMVVNMSLGGSQATATEQDAFQAAYDAGVLSIAAAGNDGAAIVNYPAAYASVVSVAAVDSANQRASFSNVNGDVELSAPGVGVISTLGWNREGVLVHGADAQVADLLGGSKVTGAAPARVTGTLVSGGSCTKSSASWAGKIVSCSAAPSARIVNAAQTVRALGVVFAYGSSGPFVISSSAVAAIPAVNVTDSAGLSAAAGKTVTLSNLATALGDPAWVGLDKKSGTSMATPHVVGAAALVWSKNPAWTNAEVRYALQATAKDLGTAGRDAYYGFGLVQAKAAYEYLTTGVLPPPPPAVCTLLASGARCTANADCCSGLCSGRKVLTCR